MGYDPFGRNPASSLRRRPYPDEEQQTQSYEDEPLANQEDTSQGYDPFGGRNAGTYQRFSQEEDRSQEPNDPFGGLHGIQNVVGGVGKFVNNLFGGDSEAKDQPINVPLLGGQLNRGIGNLPLLGGLTQTLGAVPTAITGFASLAPGAGSREAGQAYLRNSKTLGGDEPAPWDIPAVVRGLGAAGKTRADYFGGIASDPSADVPSRLGAAGLEKFLQISPYALPGPPVGRLASPVIRGAAKAIDSPAGQLATRVSSTVREGLSGGADALLRGRGEAPVAPGYSRVYRGENAATGIGPAADPAAQMERVTGGPGRGVFFSNYKKVAGDYAAAADDESLPYTQRLQNLKEGKGPGHITSMDVPTPKLGEYPIWDMGDDLASVEYKIPRSDAAARRPLQQTSRLPRFLSEEGGEGRADLGVTGKGKSKADLIREAQQGFLSIEGVQRVGDETPIKTVTTPDAAAAPVLPHHLDPEKVGVEKAARNQAVHDAHLGLISTLKEYQANPTPALEAQLADHLSTLKANGVSDASTLAKLKQAGITGLPGTRTATARLAAARVKATETPSMAAQRELAEARGVNPDQAVKGTTTPATTTAALRQQLSGTTPGPAAIPVKKSLGAQMAERAAQLRGGEQGRSLRFGMDQEAPLAVPAPPKGPLAPEGPKVPLKADTISLVKKPLQEIEAPPVGSLRAAGMGKFQAMGKDVVNSETGNRVRQTPSQKDAQLAADEMNAPGYKAPGTIAPINPFNTTVQSQLVKPLPKGMTTDAFGNPVQRRSVPKPAQAGQLKTKVQPLVTTTGPKRGTKVPGGVVAQQASATASAAIKKAAPKATTPPPPTGAGAVAVAPAPAAAPAPPSSIPAPSQPITGPVVARTAAAAKSIAAPKTTGKVKPAPSPGQLTVKQNMVNLQWEVKQPNGTIIGQGATRNQAVKAGQQYLAANPPGGGAPPPGNPPVGTGGSGPQPGPGGPSSKTSPAENIIAEVVNAPRTIETTGDISYTLRQGFILAAGHPIEAAKAFKTQIEYLVNTVRRRGDQYANEVMQKMQKEAEWKRTQDLGLETTSWDSKLGPLEEGFLNSWLAKRPVVKQSNIAAVLFLNQMRYNVAKQVLKGGKNASDAQLKAVMQFINAASGRGNLPKWLNTHAPTLNGLFYSPKFQWSRAEVVASLPKAAITRNKYLAKEAARDVVASFVAGKMITELARANGAKVEDNDTSPDWGKIQVGNTRVDIWGGFQPIARLVSQVVEGKRTTIDGKVIALDRVSGMPINEEKSTFSQLLDKYRPEGGAKDFLTKSVYGKFIRSKASPVAGLGLDWLLNEDYAGAPFNAGREAQRMVTPLGWQDIYEAVADSVANGNGWERGAATGALSLLGAGVQTIPGDNKQYPLLPEVAGRALGGSAQSLFAPSGTTFPVSSPKPSPTKKPTKTKAPGGGAYNPFGSP